MAQATQALRPLWRETNSFKNDEGELVEYHQALCLDEAGDLVMFRSSDKADVEALELGMANSVSVELRKTTTLTVPLVRPVQVKDRW